MRPSVPVLLSWQPDRLGAVGETLLTRAADLQRSAGDLTSIGSGLSAVWSGAAAQAATAHHTRRSAEVDDLATVVHTAGQALLRAAEAIGQARTSLQSALAAASAAGCTVLDDGTVLPPARPPVPGGLTDEDRTAEQAEADATAAAQAAGAARLAAQIRAALTAAGAADATSSAALSALQPPQVSPPPQPVRMGLSGGQWGPAPLPSCPVLPAAAPAPPPQEDDGGFWSDLGHGVLEVAGLIPVLGEPADGINAVWYEAEGDHLNAGLSAAGMVPFLGWGATGAKLTVKGVKAADEAADATTTAARSGPVVVKPPPNATPEELAATRAYAEGAQRALERGELSPTGRTSTSGDLRREASAEARRERLRAEAAGTPYAGHAGHVPDTTWTGRPRPPEWADLPPRVNTSLGGQSNGYPLGYRPTRFDFDPEPGAP